MAGPLSPGAAVATSLTRQTASTLFSVSLPQSPFVPQSLFCRQTTHTPVEEHTGADAADAQSAFVVQAMPGPPAMVVTIPVFRSTARMRLFPLSAISSR